MPVATTLKTKRRALPSAAASQAAETTDAELLRTIAAQKDRAAFDELHRRYEAPCYNLALNIAGHRETAEEAVQDAMLRIWRFAGSFKPGGNARGWILQTLAHSCLAVLKKDTAERKRERDAADPREAEPPANDAARSEILDALRAAVSGLPAADRRIVALYYGAECSQAEIGKKLAISQRNVSGRLARALESLRQTLAQGGFAAAAPLLGEKLFTEALTSGTAAPPDLRAAVRARVTEAAARQSARAARHAVGAFAKPALALAAALCAGAYLALASAAPQRESPEATNSGTPKASPTKMAPAPAELRRDWSFENGVPEGLELISGAWTWHPAGKHLPGHVSTDDESWTSIPVHAPTRPLRVRFELCRTSNQAFRGEFGINWVHGRTLPRRTFYDFRNSLKLKERRLAVETYLFDRYSVSVLQGQINSLVEYDEPYASDTLLLSLAHFGLARLVLDEISEDEIPAVVRDAIATRHERQSAARPEVTLRPPEE